MVILVFLEGGAERLMLSGVQVALPHWEKVHGISVKAESLSENGNSMKENEQESRSKQIIGLNISK